MHVSERLLQLYDTIDAHKRAAIQRQIKTNLASGKSLTSSFQELTGVTDTTLSNDVKSAEDFGRWLKGGKNDVIILSYYVALLEREEQLLATDDIETNNTESEETMEVETAPSLKKTESEPTREVPSVKPRYVPELPVPSRAERLHYQREIKPARPRRTQSVGLMVGLFLTMILLTVGYVAYPYVAVLLEDSPQSTVSVPTLEAEPVVETPDVKDVWIGVKNAPLISGPDSENVTYIGDIGDRYTVIEERDDYLLLDLGVNDMTAWATRDDVITGWSGPTISDPELSRWIQTAVDQTYMRVTAEEFLEMSEDEMLELLGEPYGFDSDALNKYLFYNGIFFTIQDRQVQSIDWLDTIQTKDMFLRLGQPTYEINEAVVYESQSYSLRLFVGRNESTRIRMTKL